MYKNGTFDTKPPISLKRSILEPNLLQSVYRNSCIRPIDWWQIWWHMGDLLPCNMWQQFSYLLTRRCWCEGRDV